MALTDAVAAQIMGELHVLTKDMEAQAQRVEQVAATVVAAAREINGKKSVLHAQNEALLMRRVNEITKAIDELKGMEGTMQQAARLQADTVISSTANELLNTSQSLIYRTSDALNIYKKAGDVYAAIARNLSIALVIFVMTLSGAFYAGVKVGTKSVEITNHAINTPDKQSETKRSH